MKSIDGFFVKKLIVLVVIFIVIFLGYLFYYRVTYDSIKVILNENVVKYGSKDFNINDVVEKSIGNIISVENNLDTSKLGSHTVVFKVKKHNIIRNIPVKLSVVDVLSPVIKLKKDVVKIKQGSIFNLNDNIDFVIDDVDGKLYYSEDEENSGGKYNILYKDNINEIGSHIITVKAIDSCGNISIVNYILEVEEISPYQRATKIHYNLPANSYNKKIVSAAYSLLGRPYSSSNGPDSFDCSGFVQYVYSTVGVNISRSTATQIYDGLAVDRNDMQPGDIICWGYGEEKVTHTALYVGNDQMIHSANPQEGVILSSVSSWEKGSGTRILSIRRI